MKNIGVDIVKNSRFLEMIDNSRKYNRILSPKEVEVFSTFTNETRKVQYLASRFAAKEAIIKALSKTNITFNYNEVSILNDEKGCPFVEFSFKVDFYILISISHEEDNSIAFAVLI